MAFKTCFKIWKRFFIATLKLNLWILWPLQLLSNFADQKITTKIESHLASSQGASSLWYLIPFSLLIGLCLPTFNLIVIAFTPWKEKHPQSSLSVFLKTFFEGVLKEIIRSWGKILMWTLLFVLPGFYKILEYSLVPFVVIFHPHYQIGKIDALYTSKKMFRKNYLKIGFLFLFFMIALPTFLSSFDRFRHFQSHPISASLFSLLEALIFISFTLFLYILFERNLREADKS